LAVSVANVFLSYQLYKLNFDLGTNLCPGIFISWGVDILDLKIGFQQQHSKLVTFG